MSTCEDQRNSFVHAWLDFYGGVFCVWSQLKRSCHLSVLNVVQKVGKVKNVGFQVVFAVAVVSMLIIRLLRASDFYAFREQFTGRVRLTIDSHKID